MPTSRRCGRTSPPRFPLWTATGPEGLGPPHLPRWLEADLAAQGGAWSAATKREPKAAHGRQEVRMLWAVADPALNAFVGSTGARGKPWPYLQQVCRLERRRTLLRHGQVVRREVEVTYAVTSVPPTRADAARLLLRLRGHWGIENRVHWVRDVTFDEDRCQVRCGAAPQALAACRNLAAALLRRRGYANIAAALRTHAGRQRVRVARPTWGGRP